MQFHKIVLKAHRVKRHGSLAGEIRQGKPLSVSKKLRQPPAVQVPPEAHPDRLFSHIKGSVKIQHYRLPVYVVTLAGEKRESILRMVCDCLSLCGRHLYDIRQFRVYGIDVVGKGENELVPVLCRPDDLRTLSQLHPRRISAAHLQRADRFRRDRGFPGHPVHIGEFDMVFMQHHIQPFDIFLCLVGKYPGDHGQRIGIVRIKLPLRHIGLRQGSDPLQQVPPASAVNLISGLSVSHHLYMPFIASRHLRLILLLSVTYACLYFLPSLTPDFYYFPSLTIVFYFFLSLTPVFISFRHLRPSFISFRHSRPT